MNDIITEAKISCLLFTCPLVEEICSCSLSNLRIVTSKQKIIIDEKIETKPVKTILLPRYLCMKNNTI